MIPALPQELLDRIVDFLVDKGEALRACSCTARCFRVQSQKHIFQQISLSHNSSPASFYHFLVSSPHIGPHVQFLTIARVDTSAEPLTFSQLFQHIFEALPNVHTLGISRMLDSHMLVSSISNTSFPKRIKRLVLSSTQFTHVDLLHFLSLFTSLVILEVSLVQVDTQPHLLNAGNPYILPLQHLDLNVSFCENFASVLLRNMSFPALKKLETPGYTSGDLLTLAMFIDTYPTIDTLDICGPLGSCPSEQQPISLPLSNLRYLRLEFGSSEIQHGWLLFWCGKLRNSGPLRLEVLRIHLVLHSSTDSNDLFDFVTPLHLLQEGLTHADSLQRVQISLEPVFMSRAMVEKHGTAVREACPQLIERGILAVDIETSW